MRLSMVGVGGYGAVLTRAIREVSEELGCRLVAAADNNLAVVPEQVKMLKSEGVALYDDAGEMLGALSGRCDAVYIAGGIHSHAPLTVAALEAGYHVHLEKPPAVTVEEVDRMLTAAERAERIVFVGFHQVHGPEARWLKDQLASGGLGTVRTLVCRAGWPRTRAYYERNDWAGRLRRNGEWILDGPATNALAHQINNLLYAASPEPRGYAAPTAVRAELYAAGPVESHDTAAIEIKTGTGATAYWLGSHCTQERFGPVIEIEAERGRATWDPTHRAEIVRDDGTSESREGGQERLAMIRNFVSALRSGDGSRLRCTLADARNFTLALDGAHESSGRIHRIPDDRVRVVDPGTDQQRTVVPGLDDLLVRAAEERRLFSELAGAPDWATGTNTFDMAGYREFGRRFRCE